MCFYVSWNKFSMSRVNSLWPSDAIWWHKYGSTLVQVMACWLKAPSHYLNQCSLISKVQWYSYEDNFTRYLSHQSLNLVWNPFSSISLKYPEDQSVNDKVAKCAWWLRFHKIWSAPLTDIVWSARLSCGTELSRFDYFSIMAADALPPCVATSSAAMILAVWNRPVLVFHQEGFSTYYFMSMWRNDIKCKYMFLFPP